MRSMDQHRKVIDTIEDNFGFRIDEWTTRRTGNDWGPESLPGALHRKYSMPSLSLDPTPSKA